MFDALLSHPLTIRLGWTLLYSLWQGLVLAALFGLGLLAFGQERSRFRHSLASLVMLLWLAAPVVTFLVLTPSTAGAVVSVRAEPAAQSSVGPEATTGSVDLLLAEVNTRGSAGRTVNLAAAMELRRLIPYAALAWLAIAALLSFRLLGGLVVAHRLGLHGARVPELEERLRTLVAQLGITRRVKLLVSTRVDAPTALGWLRPVILLPVSVMTGLSAAQLELILAHELAHIRRHDYFWNVVQGAAEALLFYHPVTWWLARTLRVERENACDDLALSATGAAPLALAETLARLESARSAPTPMLAATGNLAPRIRRLLGGARTSPSRATAVVPTLMLATLFLWLAVTAQAATPAESFFERHADGAIVSPYPDPPEGGWETFHTLTEISSRATFLLKAPTRLPYGYRFDNATWDGMVQQVSLTYIDSVNAPLSSSQGRTFTIMQMPASEYRRFPVGANANIEPVTIGAKAGERVTGQWVRNSEAPLAENTFQWQAAAGDLLAWQEDDIVYLVGSTFVTDTSREPADQNKEPNFAELLQVALSFTTINPAPEALSTTFTLPSDMTRQWATVEGRISFTADYAGLDAIGDDGRMVIEERTKANARRVIVTQGEPEGLDYQYSEGGAPSPFDAEARAWYEQMLAEVVLAPLRAMRLGQRDVNYRSFKQGRDSYRSLIGLPGRSDFVVVLPGPLDRQPPQLLIGTLEFLAHAAAHGLIDQGMLEIALNYDLPDTVLDPLQAASYRYAITQLESTAAREQLLERID